MAEHALHPVVAAVLMGSLDLLVELQLQQEVVQNHRTLTYSSAARECVVEFIRAQEAQNSANLATWSAGILITIGYKLFAIT